MASGLSPADFWRETPRSFVAIMEGRSRAAKRAFDLAISQAWHTEAFARTRRLKKLSAYQTAAPNRAQTPEEMLAVLRSFQSKGAKMTFRQVN